MAAPPRPSFVAGTPLAANIYDFVSDYLSSSSRDAPSMAASLTSLMAPIMKTASEIQEICHLWGIICFMTTTYHPSSPKHWLLVELVLEIKKCSAPPFEGRLMYEKQWGCAFWVDLPMLSAVWDDFEFDSPLVPRMAERKSDPNLWSNRFLPGPWRSRDMIPMSSEAWASLNAFGARLYAQPYISSLEDRALFALTEALEHEKSAKALDDVVPAAACWILYAGKNIKEHNSGYETDCVNATGIKRLHSPAWSRGSLWKGANAFSDERWTFWKTRFGELVDRTGLKRNTQQYAKQAGDEMRRIESVSAHGQVVICRKGFGEGCCNTAEKECNTPPTRRLLVSDLLN
ncbi:hypothetical protein LHYA1_G006659 [Lachnellula hyalina]|uniref:Uncharacterized protein n=1 Tax=Lachnellula hyalina TaxID=1316788 RepID=A0A8H8QXR3_9HELO|nr:uncharacterized protein LHYA1_G006659 [Lachnellula hyalina]TVY24698.1 hypothetical protein LHYA1_G006659 [Lachnellula hyalina]